MRRTYEELVEHQRRMNRLTFERLVELGLSPNDQLQLDFTFLGDDEDAARKLLSYLRGATDYDLELAQHGDVWSVTGRTQATLVTLEILDGWVAWMAAAGAKHLCEFDGWGASVG